MTGAREQNLLRAADIFMDARRTSRPIADLPAECAPATPEEVSFIQDRMASVYGAIGGWKISAGGAEATPSFSPMPAAWISQGGCELRCMVQRFRGLEAEIAFLMGEDLPPRAKPYSREEVVAAIASMHPAIEVLETALVVPKSVASMTKTADLGMNGGFVYGTAVPGWQSIDFKKETVTLSIDGAVRVERTGSNTAGDLMRLLPWLANEGAGRTGGLRKGDWITTGSWTGVSQGGPGSTAEARFTNAGSVSLRFA